MSSGPVKTVHFLDVFVDKGLDCVGLAVVVAEECAVAAGALEPGDVVVGTGHLVRDANESDIVADLAALVSCIRP